MSNKNLNQFSLLTDTNTGDYLLLWDTSASLTYKVYVNDIIRLETAAQSEWFNNIYVRRFGRISGIIGGGTGTNLISGLDPGILAGANNRAVRNQSAVLNGDDNLASGVSSLVAGESNQVFGYLAIALGGQTHFVEPEGSAVIGGFAGGIYGVDANDSAIIVGNSNTIRGDSDNSIILAGSSNQLTAQNAAIIAGTANKVSGLYSVSIGGANQVASGEYSLTIGRKTEAFPNGAHVFGDSTNAVKRAYGPDSITLNYSGGAWVTGGGLNARRGFNIYPTGDTPTSSIGGRSGDFAYKDDYLYVFTGDNADLSNKNWGRIQLSTLNSTPPSVVSNDSAITYGGTGWNATIADSYFIPTATGGGVRFAGPGNIGPTNLSVTLPAGQGTYVIDCIFGIRKGSYSTSLDYMLYNTTDSRIVPNSSGAMLIEANNLDAQFTIKVITGIHSSEIGTSKVIQLYCRRDPFASEDPALSIISTGTMISYIKLR